MSSPGTTSTPGRTNTATPDPQRVTPAASAIINAKHPPDQDITLSRKILTELLGPIVDRDFAIRYWDGTIDRPVPPVEPSFTLVLRHPGSLRRMFLPPTERHIGEAYFNDDFDIEDDIEAATALESTMVERCRSPRRIARLARMMLGLPKERGAGPSELDPSLHGKRHSTNRDTEAIRFHYNVGNEFYSLWLDRNMEYSAAWFRSEADSLDHAQEAKLDRICRRLRLAPGESFLDIGCGWGALVIHAARNFGVDATGITLSEEQARFARERIAAAGLESRCRIEVVDYREVPGKTLYDKIASVGMVEHVGKAKLPDYYHHAARLLVPGGLFLLRGIVDLEPPSLGGPLGHFIRRRTSFIDSHVFPDGELVSPATLIGPAENAGLETRELESLREQYMLTLRRWVQRLEQNRDRAVELVGEATYRVWRLYMAGSAHAFDTGKIGLVQVLFGKQDRDGRVAVLK